jgi:hypothetical protein
MFWRTEGTSQRRLAPSHPASMKRGAPRSLQAPNRQVQSDPFFLTDSFLQSSTASHGTNDH